MSITAKRIACGVVALVCFLWLRDSWQEYRIVGGNVSEVGASAVLTLLFALLTLNPDPRRHNDPPQD